MKCSGLRDPAVHVRAASIVPTRGHWGWRFSLTIVTSEGGARWGTHPGVFRLFVDSLVTLRAPEADDKTVFRISPWLMPDKAVMRLLTLGICELRT